MGIYSTRIATRTEADRSRQALIYRPKDRLIFELLHGIAGDAVATLHEARALGIDLTQPRAVVLVDAIGHVLGSAPPNPGLEDAGDIQRRSREVVAAIVRFFKLPRDTICADLGDGEIGVLKASNSRNLDGWVDGAAADEPTSPSWANLAALKRAARDLLVRLHEETRGTLSIGVGRYHPGITGLNASYRDARAALMLGRRLIGPSRVYCLDDLGIASFVGLDDERTKIDLAHHLLSPIDHEPELLETVDAFFAADCSPSATARSLAIHRNTLGYRLAKIASLSGLDPRRFDDAVQIRIALELRGFGPEPVRRADAGSVDPRSAAHLTKEGAADGHR